MNAGPSPLESLRARWEAEARAGLAERLRRHADRLTPAEREAYAAALETATGAEVQRLRRKLLDRLLLSARYRRRPRVPRPARRASDAAPAGPYNDFQALEEILGRMESLHPEWAAEFLEIYGKMGGVRKAYEALLPGAKRG